MLSRATPQPGTTLRMRSRCTLAGKTMRAFSRARQLRSLYRSVNMSLHFVACVCLLTYSVVVAEDPSSTLDLVRTLKGQMDLLLARRQQDFRLLEDSLRRTLEKNSELSTLRSEVQNLRHEVDTLRGHPSQQRNDHLTVRWLAASLNEVRAELKEMATSYNASAELRQSRQVEAQVAVVRGEVAGFRRELEALRVAMQTGEARVDALEQELEAARDQGQSTAAVCAETEAKLQLAQADWSAALSSMQTSPQHKLFKSVQIEKLANAQEVVHENSVLVEARPPVLDSKRYRHQRVVHKHLELLDSSDRALFKGQARLEQRMRGLEKEVKAVRAETLGPELEGRLQVAARAAADKVLFNVSRQVAGLDKLHGSMLELLESVEALEAKVDRSLPDLRREISKIEVNQAQLTSTMALVKEDQENQRMSVKAMGGGLSSMQGKIDSDHRRINDMQHQRQTAPKTSSASTQESSDDATISSGDNSSLSVPKLVEQLTRVVHEYHDVLSKMPRDCSTVKDGSGLYLIAPGGGEPLMTSCDQDTGAGGWTLVQRRTDGTMEFNRKWGEYAVGFGSASGEFWLGNEALHRLTSDNSSSLRIDMVDIYGKAWHAEYQEFSVGPKEDGYRLYAAGYQGNASDALEYQNHMQFSAIDSDRDVSNTHCAANYEGGWWFSHCQHSNLNGRYSLGLTWFDASRNEWIAVAKSEMKVRSRHMVKT